MQKIKGHGRSIFGIAAISMSGLTGAAQVIDDPSHIWQYAFLYGFLLLLGVFVSTLIDTKFDDRIMAQELKTLLVKNLSDIQDEAKRLEISLKIDKKCRWIKASVSLFIGIVGGLSLADYYALQIPGLRLALITTGLSAFGPAIFLGLLRAVIRLDYKELAVNILTQLISSLSKGKGKRKDDGDNL